ncbi:MULTISPECIES: molybdopterin-dependent oxidoreductase [unclassified Streptomyces]|uniref:molybdopterin-dependent oxidoreductase n=1 Tax=unclassified Streptomyces TaxID=2593676 RepID=UPI0006F618DD|nr:MULTISPECIES: molybdopterin-dependent oxidoreductase [unclassified Streptomyces]KQX50756.1 molybdopterin-binding protein [Streptomyces sp. Root1304]KRA84921.1 molybdopterin-binding protein [Streptomyces sp. Root66D1]
MRPTPPHGPPITFRARLHDARTATALGRWLGLAVVVCFVTGVLSHCLQHPPGPLVDRLPSRPSWGYRFTQGLHVASGTAAIPLLLAKLWAVYPRLFAWPPVRSVRHAAERLSVAVLVAAGIFELATGLLNTFQWYPWPFSFVPAHYAVAWLLLGALLLHIAVQWPRIRDHLTRRSPGTLALPAADEPDRRRFLAAVAAGVGAVTLTTVGQSVTALGPLNLFAPRSPAPGPRGLPVNRTAEAARVTGETLADWRLVVAGPRPYTLTLEELRALPQHEETLPLACVEGWSRSARWTGVRVRDLLDLAGAGPNARCRVVSLEAAGAYRVMEMGRRYARDPLTLLALRLDGEVLSPDHGYPARIIAPNRPGVLQTKWVGRLEVV